VGLYAVVFGVLVVLALAMPAGTSRATARRNAKIARRNAAIADALEAQSAPLPPRHDLAE
jgi:hypothetical protein